MPLFINSFFDSNFVSLFFSSFCVLLSSHSVCINLYCSYLFLPLIKFSLSLSWSLITIPPLLSIRSCTFDLPFCDVFYDVLSPFKSFFSAFTIFSSYFFLFSFSSNFFSAFFMQLNSTIKCFESVSLLNCMFGLSVFFLVQYSLMGNVQQNFDVFCSIL